MKHIARFLVGLIITILVGLLYIIGGILLIPCGLISLSIFAPLKFIYDLGKNIIG